MVDQFKMLSHFWILKKYVEYIYELLDNSAHTLFEFFFAFSFLQMNIYGLRNIERINFANMNRRCI